MKPYIKYSLFKIFALSGVLFWLSESIYFQIACGWHLTVVNESEKNCFNVAFLICSIAVIILMFVFYDMVDAFVKSKSVSKQAYVKKQYSVSFSFTKVGDGDAGFTKVDSALRVFIVEAISKEEAFGTAYFKAKEGEELNSYQLSTNVVVEL